MIWRLRSDEPSFSSINEKSFESRRVRTQPCTNMFSTGAVLFSASLTEIGEGCVMFDIERLTRSSPDSLAATLAAQPSMSLVPLAPFLDLARNDKLRGYV